MNTLNKTAIDSLDFFVNFGPKQASIWLLNQELMVGLVDFNKGISVVVHKSEGVLAYAKLNQQQLERFFNYAKSNKLPSPEKGIVIWHTPNNKETTVGNDGSRAHQRLQQQQMIHQQNMQQQQMIHRQNMQQQQMIHQQNHLMHVNMHHHGF